MLMDFGISHLLETTSALELATHAGRGSLRWLAPELVLSEGLAQHTTESDIWALGMTYLAAVEKWLE